MLDGLSQEIEKHPALIALAVLIVAVLAYYHGQSQPQQVDYTYAGGGAARAIDPEAAAIEQSAIAAGAQNMGTIAQLYGLMNSNETALTGSLAQTSAARDTSLAATAAQRDTSLAATAANETVSLSDIAAQREAALAAIAAGQETTDAQTAAGVTIAAGNNSAAVQAAQINGQTQSQIIAANLATAKMAADNQNFAIQAGKDQARAAANASIVNGVTKTIGDVISFLNPFHWHF